ncbi:hypothetical protein D7322_15980 [Sphingobacterium puteale]|uniref:Uncharacterized protein n=1 Tax=Sphingobacterium puteale TaxID=2420510 RepID=A0A420VWL6_9SPHI|nr:hypothetical protein [Sphingobacterium puteale]RKO70766.1 hypothetical protein D7322_15980 [Sphingobacterium puteale]
MKNNFSNYKTDTFYNIAIKNNIKTGKMLKALRNLLVRQPDEIASVLSMTTNTLKNAEKGANVGTEVINELIGFYGYTPKDFHSLESLPTWEELLQKIESFHKANKSDVYLILKEKPNLIDLIEHRLLNTKLFKNWVDENSVLNFCKTEYDYSYESAINTLNNAVTKGWLIRDDSVKPKKYKMVQ